MAMLMIISSGSSLGAVSFADSCAGSRGSLRCSQQTQRKPEPQCTSIHPDIPAFSASSGCPPLHHQSAVACSTVGHTKHTFPCDSLKLRSMPEASDYWGVGVKPSHANPEFRPA